MLAFADCSTIVHHIRNTISQVIEQIGVDKVANIWDTISQVVGHDIELFHMNNKRDAEGIKCRHIRSHSPLLRAWGFEFRVCGIEGCRPTQYNFAIWHNTSRVKMVCRLCKWESVVLKESNIRGLLFRLNSTVPVVFWHKYPASEELQDIFMSTSKRQRHLQS